ncbi:type II toxin-antitoxin system VapC family toxin [Blastococcus capsensis]|nr:type II toxin-antitoxin system VapC family toxin [Blastococcus capsensis]MDK3258530.1 type II toxin-antitoxin system VapC family toxin [Blastococcus capsensis]
MITYLDTSAIVPLLIEEPGSATCLSLWSAAADVVCSQLGYVETAAALARATRLGRMTAEQEERGLAQLDQVWDEMTVVPVDESLVRQAAALARDHALRGFDAVHCAAALRIADTDVVAASADGDLLAAWRTEGLHVADTRA